MVSFTMEMVAPESIIHLFVGFVSAINAAAGASWTLANLVGRGSSSISSSMYVSSQLGSLSSSLLEYSLSSVL